MGWWFKQTDKLCFNLKRETTLCDCDDLGMSEKPTHLSDVRESGLMASWTSKLTSPAEHHELT